MCPADPTRATCSRTRAKIQLFSPHNCAGTGFNWENLRSRNSWLLCWQPPSWEIAGLGAGVVMAGTTRWIPGRSKQVLQKTGGTWHCGEPRDPRREQSWQQELTASPIPGVTAPRGRLVHSCCDAIGVTSPVVPLSWGDPTPCPARGKAHLSPSAGKQIPGKEHWDCRGGSPRKEHPLGLDRPP